MSASKSPSRIIDGPYAGWGTNDEQCKITLTNNSTVKLGQPLSIDVTQLGPDANVPNNGVALPQCEFVVATTSTNAGPVFGVVTAVPGAILGIVQSFVNGVPTYTNKSGSTLTITVTVRQLGWAYVWAGSAPIGSTGGNSILVGSTLVTTSAQAFAIQGTAAIASTVGTALATAINATEGSIIAGVPTAGGGAPAGPGVISVAPTNMVGIVPNALLLIDSLPGGVQETVSVGSISGPTASIALANAHPSGFKITGSQSNKSGVLISTPGAGITNSGLVACWVNLY